MSHKDEVFDALDIVMDQLRSVSYMTKDICVSRQAEALMTLTLAVQEQVRELDESEFEPDPRDYYET